MSQKDNSTFDRKVALRRRVLREVEGKPVVMETHAGKGRLYLACYSGVDRGIAIEKDPTKTAILARQRPEWAIYEGDSETLIAGGIGAHLPVNVLDIDPYGSPWPVLDAFFGSERDLPATLHVVVHDGLRQKVQRKGAHEVPALRPIVEAWGNDLWPVYLEACQVLMTSRAHAAGYELTSWAGYYCGHSLALTHWAAVLKR